MTSGSVWVLSSPCHDFQYCQNSNLEVRGSTSRPLQGRLCRWVGVAHRRGRERRSWNRWTCGGGASAKPCGVYVADDQDILMKVKLTSSLYQTLPKRYRCPEGRLQIKMSQHCTQFINAAQLLFHRVTHFNWISNFCAKNLYCLVLTKREEFPNNCPIWHSDLSCHLVQSHVALPRGGRGCCTLAPTNSCRPLPPWKGK